MKALEIIVDESDNEFTGYIINVNDFDVKESMHWGKSEQECIDVLAKRAFKQSDFKAEKINKKWIVKEVTQTIKKSRAEEAKKRREKQTLIQFVATKKAEENLKKLCESTGLNKTQVINKLLEEQEQLSLL